MAVVHTYLADLNNYVELHPLIESISEVANVSLLPNARCYRVVDRLAWGPFRFKVVYTAALETPNANTIRGFAWQFPRVSLTTVYQLSRDSATTDRADKPGQRFEHTPLVQRTPDDQAHSATRLQQSTSVNAPWGLRHYVTQQAKSAHSQTLLRLAQVLDTR